MVNNNMQDKNNTISNRKRINSQSDKDVNVKNRRLSKDNTLELMNKLEKFSSVWNDCPDVNNDTYSAHLSEINERKGYSKVNNDVNNIKKHLRENSNADRKITKTNMPNEDYCDKTQFYTKMKDDSKTEFTDSTNESSFSIKKNRSELSDLKRKKAVIGHRQLFVDQQKLIKQALSSLDGGKSNKKIIFSDDNSGKNELVKESVVQKKNDRTECRKLFDDDDDSEIETKLKTNPQFEGRKGQKLLELQSKFASDSRFALDTRFYESGSEASENELPQTETQSDEKEKQLAILGSIVNREIKPLSKMKNSFSKQKEYKWMVRFDPTREDHSKYVVKTNESGKNGENIEKKKNKQGKEQNKKVKNNERIEENKTKVSDEKFYSVKEDLKEVLKTEKKTEFSLLQLFGPKETQDSDTEPEGSKKLNKLKYNSKNPFKYDSSDSENEEEMKLTSKQSKQKSKVTQPESSSTWRTTFFFTENDLRLQEALDFLKAPEDQEDGKEFAEKRKILKVFIKNKFKNNHRKNGLFKKKLGGLKKKPISKNKFKKR